jgi:hypothetical protein
VVVAKGARRTEYEVRDSNVIKLADRITPVSLKKDYELDKSKTDKNGFYKILYSPNQYKNFLNENPDIWVVIKDTLDVTELFITDKYPDVSETIKKN